MAQFAEQCAQPSLPVPMLSHTVDLLLQSLRPLATPEEIESVKQSAAEYACIATVSLMTLMGGI